MPPDRASNAPATPMGDWGDFAPAPAAPPPLEAELVEPPEAVEDAAFRALVEEIEGLPPLEAVEITDPPVEPGARSLIDEIEGPPAPPPAPVPVAPDWLDAETRGALDRINGGAPAVPKPRPPRAMPVARPVPPRAPEPEPTDSQFPQIVSCPRCGEKVEPVESRCPWCNKWLVGSPPKPKREREPEPDESEPDWYDDARASRSRESAAARQRGEHPPLVVVFVTYGLLLASLIGMSAVAGTSARSQQDLNVLMFVVGVIDIGLTLGALALVKRQAEQPPASAPAAAWVLALPGLVLLLFLNITYITFLRDALKPLGAEQLEKAEVTLATLLLICIIPGFMEELFFRQVMLGVFRRAMSLHSAVWLTGGLFALAHLGNPLGMPYLFVAGAAFGYARVTGGLPLAMLLHFLHNLAVVSYEASK